LDISQVDLKNLTQNQKDFILDSESIKNIAISAIEQYKNLQDEAQKT
jgi:hypothetical protein